MTANQIDNDNLNVIFGGRIRVSSGTASQSSTITVTFYDGSGNVLKKYTAVAENTSDRWELVGSSQSIPANARTALFEFTATNGQGYLDAPFLYVQPNSERADQGAQGNTSTSQTQNVVPHLGLRTPDLYTDWLRNTPQQIVWNSFGNVNSSEVRIDLYQDGPNGPQFLTNITTATPDTGEYTWTAASSGINYGTYGLRSCRFLFSWAMPNKFDRSTETFTVPENTRHFMLMTAVRRVTSTPQRSAAIAMTANYPAPKAEHCKYPAEFSPGAGRHALRGQWQLPLVCAADDVVRLQPRA